MNSDLFQDWRKMVDKQIKEGTYGMIIMNKQCSKVIMEAQEKELRKEISEEKFFDLQFIVKTMLDLGFVTNEEIIRELYIAGINQDERIAGLKIMKLHLEMKKNESI